MKPAGKLIQQLCKLKRLVTVKSNLNWEERRKSGVLMCLCIKFAQKKYKDFHEEFDLFGGPRTRTTNKAIPLGASR